MNINNIVNNIEIPIVHDCAGAGLNPNKVCIDNIWPIVSQQNQYSKNNLLYNFKRYFKGISTDNYMKTLYNNRNYYKTLTYLVYLYINLGLSSFINRYNFINGVLIDDHDVKLLYKGGNTTRIHLEFITKKYNAPNLVNRYNRTSVGDWDYNISINYQNLINKHIDIHIFIIKLKKVLDYSLSKIKERFNLFFPHLYNQYANNIISDLENINTYNIIQDYMIKYNNLVAVPADRINNINIREVNIVDHNQKIVKLPLHYNKNEPNLNLNINDTRSFKMYHVDDNDMRQINVINYYPYPNIYASDIIPTPDSPIFISYIDSIKGKNFKRNPGFALYRLKINNKLIYDQTVGGNVDEKNINIPIELIDVSINSPDANGPIISYIHLHNILNIHNNYTQYNFSLDTGMNITYPIEVPSTAYMYNDVLSMLIIDGIFPWLDIKYAKRIDRLCLLYILTYLENNDNVYIRKILNFRFILSTIFDHLIDTYLTYINMIIDYYNHHSIDNCKQAISNYDLNPMEEQYVLAILVYIYNTNILNCNINTLVPTIPITHIAENIEYKYINVYSPYLINNLDYLLLPILSNIYSCIIIILYLYGVDFLNQQHINYCDTYILKYISCDNNDCKYLSGNIYSFQFLVNNRRKYLNQFIIYIITLFEKFNSNYRDVRYMDNIIRIPNPNIDQL
jgi:hypothetical protein